MKNKYLVPCVVSISIATIMFPELVLAGITSIGGGGDSINNVLVKVLDLMTGNVAKALAVSAIAGSGYLAYIGQLPWMNMFKIAIGAGIMFGSASIGTLLYGGL